MERPATSPIPEISAYILAGGHSSRMGRDKALLELAGKPLIEHAATKLRRITPNVHILSANSALSAYAPLVHDLHPGTGPIGGIEAALAHTTTEWNLILPVDVPFLPTIFLAWWVRTVVHRPSMRLRIALFRVSGWPQPTLLLIHRDAAPYLTLAISRGEYKLLPALEIAAQELALPSAQSFERVPYMLPIDEHFRFEGWQDRPPRSQSWQLLTAAQRDAQPLWFANLNTPEDFAEAELHTDALDT